VDSLTKRRRVELTHRLLPHDRPPFVPAIYEHKARLISRTPSEICRSAELLEAALERELAVYDPDMLVVGVDVYNVEAEALGARVIWFDDSSVPTLAEPPLHRPEDLDKLSLPDPECDGRMPLFLSVAGALARRYRDSLIVRGAVTGPFSLASALLGPEPLLMACIEQPDFVRRLLALSARVTELYATAFLQRGAQPIIFDSRAAPPLLSPRLFRELLLPVYRDYLFPSLKSAGGRFLPLIIGGNTTPLLDSLIASGATQLLCDAPANLDAFLLHCSRAGLPFRVNVDARLVHSGPPQAIREATLSLLQRAGHFPGLLLGCGIVAYDTPPSHVLAIREALLSWAS
jgi:uroporphyrinogen decarboxylase